jgi:Ca-activated chloride channel family protein
MTNDRSSLTRNGHEGNSDLSTPRVEARWERTLVAASGGTATLLVRVTAPGDAQRTRRAPLDVALVLDRSGSMSGGKLDLAKEGVDLAVALLRDADRAALVIYDDAVDVLQPLAAATPRVKASLRVALQGVDQGGSTFLSGGWTEGCRQLAEAPALPGEDGTATRIRRAILLTDGLANVGIVDARELGRHAGELRRRGIATTTVGVGLDFDEGLLSAMAEAGGGNFQYVADPSELREFFARELQEMFRVTATGLTITLAMPSGVDAELISAFPCEKRGTELEVTVGDLPAGDEIDLVFTLRVGHGVVGDRLPVGVTAAWTDPRADTRRELDASPVSLHRAEAGEVAAAAPDELVSERAALQRAAAERRAGLELDRAGQFQESRVRMDRAMMFLQAAPRTDDVQADLIESFHLAQAPATASYGSHERKGAQHREEQRRRGRFWHGSGR